MVVLGTDDATQHHVQVYTIALRTNTSQNQVWEQRANQILMNYWGISSAKPKIMIWNVESLLLVHS